MLVKKGAGVVSLMAALQFLLLLRFLTLMSMLLGSPTAQFLVKYTVHISSGVAWSKTKVSPSQRVRSASKEPPFILISVWKVLFDLAYVISVMRSCCLAASLL